MVIIEVHRVDVRRKALREDTERYDTTDDVEPPPPFLRELIQHCKSKGVGKT